MLDPLFHSTSLTPPNLGGKKKGKSARRKPLLPDPNMVSAQLNGAIMATAERGSRQLSPAGGKDDRISGLLNEISQGAGLDQQAEMPPLPVQVPYPRSALGTMKSLLDLGKNMPSMDDVTQGIEKKVQGIGSAIPSGEGIDKILRGIMHGADDMTERMERKVQDVGAAIPSGEGIDKILRGIVHGAEPKTRNIGDIVGSLLSHLSQKGDPNYERDVIPSDMPYEGKQSPYSQIPTAGDPNAERQVIPSDMPLSGKQSPYRRGTLKTIQDMINNQANQAGISANQFIEREVLPFLNRFAPNTQGDPNYERQVIPTDMTPQGLPLSLIHI